MMANSKLTRGVGLIELMVAIAIGLLITAAVSLMFVNTRKAYHTQEHLSRVQENGRFAMQYLLSDLRMAGYMGCWTGKLSLSNPGAQIEDGSNFRNRLNITGTPPFSLLVGSPLEGLDGDNGAVAWAPSGSTDLPASIVAGTDMLTIRMMDPATLTWLTAPMQQKHSPLVVNSVDGLSDGQVVIITDCSGGDIFQITGISNTPPTIQHATGGSQSPGNTTPQLRKEYGSDALDDASPPNVVPNAVTISRFITRRYFIRNNPSGVPSLFMDENGGAAVELVEGIEDIQVLYGVDLDLDGQPNRYFIANAVPDWLNVVSVRIGILARTPDDNHSEVDTGGPYDVNGRSYTPPAGDRHQRRVFTATVKLRNRGLP